MFKCLNIHRPKGEAPPQPVGPRAAGPTAPASRAAAPASRGPLLCHRQPGQSRRSTAAVEAWYRRRLRHRLPVPTCSVPGPAPRGLRPRAAPGPPVRGLRPRTLKVCGLECASGPWRRCAPDRRRPPGAASALSMGAALPRTPGAALLLPTPAAPPAPPTRGRWRRQRRRRLNSSGA